MKHTIWLAWPAILVLVGLGIWQMQRLEWKTALIETIEARRAAPVIPVPPALDSDQYDNWEFTRVALSGTFRHESEMAVVAQTHAGRVGIRLVTPMDLDDGRTLLVDRGWTPDADSAERPTGKVLLEGLLRAPIAGNPFRPDNHATENIWYWIDAPAMARAASLPPQAYYVQAVAPEAPGRYPTPGGAVLHLRNDHLQYALTWFGLATALLVITLLFRRHARRAAR